MDLPLHEGIWVWAKHASHVWSPVRIVKVCENGQFDVSTLSGETGRVARKDLHSVASWNCLDNEMQTEYFHSDLSKMNSLTTPAVLYSLREMYHCGVFYRKLGASTVLAINPFQEVDEMFSKKMISAYHSASAVELSAMPAHVFSVVEKARRDMLSSVGQSNQSIIISGESGAGKTWTVSCLMHYLTFVGIDSNNNEDVESDDELCESLDLSFTAHHQIEKRILSSNPILEAFGNAATPRNHNSSRFGKYIQLQYNRAGSIIGAALQIYLLEKTRVARKDSFEQTFHIFYQMLSGGTQEQKVRWCFVEHEGGDNINCNSNVELPIITYSDQDGKLLETQSENLMETARAFRITQNAMSAIGIPAETQMHIFTILAAILHLGKVQLEGSDDFNDPCVPTKACHKHLKYAACLMAVPINNLVQAVTVRHIEAGKLRKSKRRSIVKKACTKQECAARLEALMKSVYEVIFHWVVKQIVSDIAAPQNETHSFIGLLDIYGFESFQQNGLEQLCINYANEKLQHYYVENFLKLQQEELSQEEISWDMSELVEKVACLQVLESPQTSLFALLNEECRLNRSTNAVQLMNRIFQSFSKSKYVTRASQALPSFVVTHYAGKVGYTTDQLISKNKDELPSEVVDLLLSSENEFLKSLFLARYPESKVVHQPKRGKGNQTVLVQFKRSLDSLITTMASTNCHYIRCIKPNQESVPKRFDSLHVVDQLKSSGIVETIQICGYFLPYKMTYHQFLNQFMFLLTPEESRSVFEMPQHYTKKVIDNVQHSSEAIPSKAYQFGKRSVFLSSDLYELLHKIRAKRTSESVKSIAKWWKSLVLKWSCRAQRKRQLLARAMAATVLQKAWRLKKLLQQLSHNRKQEWAARNAAAKTIQCAWIKYMANQVKQSTSKLTASPNDHLLKPFVESDDEQSLLSISCTSMKYASVQFINRNDEPQISSSKLVHTFLLDPWICVFFPGTVLIAKCIRTLHLSPIEFVKSLVLDKCECLYLWSDLGANWQTASPILPYANIIPKSVCK